MKYTNRLNLPAPIVEAIVNSGYNKGESDITATGIIEPIRIHVLKERHNEQLVEDVSDRIYSIQGQSIHTLLERAAVALKKEGWIAETRYYMQMGGYKLGAQIDVYDSNTGTLQDYKVTSVYSVKDGVKEDYAKQLNIQAECMRQNGLEVKTLQIVAILRDWSKGERDRDVQAMGELARYPEHQVKILNVPLIPQEEVRAYIAARLQDLKATQEGGPLPMCTEEERWQRPSVWAVMKKGQKRAVRLLDSEKTAIALQENLGKDHYLEYRPGESIRCNNYCPVKDFCDQHKNNKTKGQTNGKNE